MARGSPRSNCGSLRKNVSLLEETSIGRSTASWRTKEASTEPPFSTTIMEIGMKAKSAITSVTATVSTSVLIRKNEPTTSITGSGAIICAKAKAAAFTTTEAFTWASGSMAKGTDKASSF